jgi:UDP-N-acetylmuramoyl-L-alanyl-D-glutamate--2,6-diaminopimelate ligase
MLLHDLIHQFDPSIALSGVPDVPLTGVRDDSRRVRPGDLFIARGGTQTDGANYAADAAARGAVAVVTESILPEISIPQILIPKPAAAAGILAHLFHSRPTETVKTIAITGTNGKTTTAYLIRHLLAHAKQRCGLIGTVEIDDGLSRVESTLTTPGPCELAELLASMRDKGCRACAMEVSSHALDQNRVAGMRFAAAGFTNLTGDHLDYHKSKMRYATAKARLFEALDQGAAAVVNGHDGWSARMLHRCRARILRFGFGDWADYQAREVSTHAGGARFMLKTPAGRAPVKLSLIGRHNIENALLAGALVAETFGLSADQIAAGLNSAAGAPGRLQAVEKGQPFSVVVDYAHTDDALRNVLSSLRPITKGKLRVVFGCGGDRDATKRPRMARVAERLADVIYLTSDNPRGEEPDSILNMVAAGFSKRHDKPVFREIDRRLAIERALLDAEEGDVVLLAGKGHENYQIIGKEKRHFDDVEEATRVLQERGFVEPV